MSVEGVKKLVDELAGGSPPFRSFGEQLQEQLAEVVMYDKGSMQEEAPEQGEAPEEGAESVDPEDDRKNPEMEPDQGAPTTED